MADGVRIRATDPNLHGAVLQIKNPDRVMGHNGEAKTYTIHLDAQGAATVSETVWLRLQEIVAKYPDSTPRFIVTGNHRNPPTIVANGDVETRPVFRSNPQGKRFDPIGTIVVPKLVLRDN